MRIGLCLILAAWPMAALADSASSFEGRWRQSLPSNDDLTIGVLDIARCGEGLCGRLVTDQGCGATILRSSLEPYFKTKEGLPSISGPITGMIETNGTLLPALLYPDKDKLRISAAEGGRFFATRTMPLPFEATLIAAGPAQCQDAPAS